jgi:hypothetical protein
MDTRNIETNKFLETAILFKRFELGLILEDIKKNGKYESIPKSFK